MVSENGYNANLYSTKTKRNIEQTRRQSALNVRYIYLLNQPVTLLGSLTMGTHYKLKLRVKTRSPLMVKFLSFNNFIFIRPLKTSLKIINYPLEAHFVHDNEEGELAELSVMFDEGLPNSALTQLISHVPEKENTDFFNAGFKIKKLFPESTHYYRFNCSLTTPRVRWFVLKDTQPLAKEQAAKLMSVMGQNSRPLQPLNIFIMQLMQGKFPITKAILLALPTSHSSRRR